jgi:hypothetical protein
MVIPEKCAEYLHSKRMAKFTARKFLIVRMLAGLAFFFLAGRFVRNFFAARQFFALELFDYRRKSGDEIRGQTGRFLLSCPRMARPPRIAAINTPHHVTQRGDARKFTLSNGAEKSENVPSVPDSPNRRG